MKKQILLLLLFLLVTTNSIYSYNLRQISNRDGLSNSSVTCLFQDSERFLWIGTYDGLNMYDSRNIYIYKPDINNQNSLSSNVIRNIIETDGEYLWISTKWGLNKLSQKNNVIEEYHNEFGDNSYTAKDSHDNLFVFTKPGILSLYSKTQKKFIEFPIHKETENNKSSGMLLIIDEQNTIWINHQGTLERYAISNIGSDSPKIKQLSDFKHTHPIQYTFYNNKKIIAVDSAGNLYYITPQSSKFIKNIATLVKENGEIGSIILDNEDILIGFKTNGLIRLDAAKNYNPEKIEINCGVFALCKDEQQDIVWIGTDGQGVYAWTKDEYTLNNISLNQLPIDKKRPIRAIYTDQQNTLWLGTKDNGIIQIKEYDSTKNYSTSNVKHFTTQNGLTNNAVFAFAHSKKYPIVWIGSDGPNLNYYSYSDNKIHTLINKTKSGISHVHSIVETNDSILWAGSGSTLLQIYFAIRKNTIEIEDIKPVRFKNLNEQQYNQIYSIYQENDSILWVGMRGNGVIRLNTLTNKQLPITFDEKGIAPMNDILCIHQDKRKNIWIGSSYGLTKLKLLPNDKYSYENFNENEGLPNNTIHGITEDPQGNLWLSSNTGLILFDPTKNTFRSLNHKTGLKITEFSDNAYFQDHTRNRSFFGGVDGIVWIKKEAKKKKQFIPNIYFTKLRIFNQDYNISEFEETKGNQKSIVLNHDQNFFAISFVAMDFINGENSRYSYKLENFSEVWMDTRSNEAQFTNIPPGNYVLKVKYNDGINNNENLIKKIHVIILPPWYQSITAQIIYVLLAIGISIGIFRYVFWKYERRKASISRKLNERYKEEMYEGKLRFFTNITHEFCTPLTLIYGPCERILHYDKSDSFIKKYAQIIKSNTERLNSLIQEVIDFRRMETGNQICHIQELNISELANEIIESFGELAEQNHIHMETDVTPDIIWRSDNSGFTKILSNLISNAFKYTPKNGTIKISIKTNDNKLNIKVYNTGKGISQEDIPLIFNRYSVLDNIKENSIKGLSSRNGLGLAICQSMVELLQGTIEVESKIDQYAEFIVNLPQPNATEDTDTIQKKQRKVEYPNNKTERPISEKATSEKQGNQQEATILIIDDNQELLWMLKDILSDEYTILTAENGEEGLTVLKQKSPNLIITDIMMPKIDGITLTKQIKGNKHTAHIPLVILSAKNTTDESIEGIESGADAYIPKPFNTQYLKTIIKQLIKKQEELKQYYNSSASAFEFCGGQLLQNEDKQYLQTAIEIINKNMDNTKFTPDELAEAMQTSSRNLYRKFKDLGQLPPKDFIKEQRINYAAKLLLTTTLTIQEIMYRTAFTNRSHFNREFAKRNNNQTPREYRETNKHKDDSFI
ncbi:two-component regulator propeller domain-containing protein [Bacteroides fluxus]|uniref:hybrid sensor histidine kinase/response regulator transcription factor n=1 Tax=Bacteroides fluxus TaxID=626930 RepID=UPI0023558E52|nr:two-component regulator propeller domain-containing protein [Bacteroides fluxus]